MPVILSADDKAKGKRIITQFFRTMPVVQKNLMSLFEKDGYEGVSRLQNLLYPTNAAEIDSIDNLRKGLSMILQHIYGMPVEDKEGYFQEVLRCKTHSQVVRKEKETLINFFYNDLPNVKEYLKTELTQDADFRFMNALCQKFLGEGETIADMRAFKNQIRALRESFAEQLGSGTTEDVFIGTLKEFKAAVDSGQAGTPSAEAAPGATAGTAPDDQTAEKKRIITTTLGDEKYHAMRDLLLHHVVSDASFTVLQTYLDNILAPASRVIAKDMATFSEGVHKIKEFRDQVEKELVH